MRRSWRWPLAGFVLGGLVGMTVLTASVVGAFDGKDVVARDVDAGQGLRDLLHSPPLLVSRDALVKLSYEVVCQSDDFGKPCALEGSVFVRAVGDTDYAAVPLVQEGAQPEGTLAATLPARYSRGDGFDYYAVVKDAQGESTTFPAGGGAAPQHAWAVGDWTTVDLGSHQFGKTRAPDENVVRASWGSGDAELGLVGGRWTSAFGPSAFDVAQDGSVIVLDQVNRRLAVYRRGSTTAAQHRPIPFGGGEGGIAIGADGTTYVLEAPGAGSRTPLLRAFDASGRLLAKTSIGAPNADILRVGPGGPVVHSLPSDMWLPAGSRAKPLPPGEQVGRARVGRDVGGGVELIVRAFPTEARFALVNGERVIRGWRVTSATTLGEVQLAEPQGSGLLVVLRLWTEKQAEFEALRLTPSGLSEAFSVDPAEWAESGALSRFRLVAGRLYQLRSSSAGAEIVAFKIGGTR